MDKNKDLFSRRKVIPEQSKGFTLIELLVAITIVAVLSAIGLVAYSYVLKQGRDARRQSDLRAIQSALEQYNSDQGFYPCTKTNGGCPASGTGSTGLDDLLANAGSLSFTSAVGNPYSTTLKTYMNSLPHDPTNPTGTMRYTYEALPDNPLPCDNSTPTKCTSYCLYANLDIPGPVKPAACSNAAYAGYYFALTPP